MNLESRINENNITISNIKEEHQQLSLENVAEVNKLAEQKSLLDEYKSELDRFTSENEQWQETIETRLEDINITIYQLGCPNGGNFLTIKGGCYLFRDESMHYNDAKSFCENKNANGRAGHLVEPKTTSVYKLITDQAKIVFGRYSYWIGLSDINSEGIMVYTSTGLPATTNFFRPGQPNADGDCVYTCSEDEWCDTPCDGRWNVICEF